MILCCDVMYCVWLPAAATNTNTNKTDKKKYLNKTNSNESKLRME